MQAKRLLRLEWDTIAGITAAVIAILLDFLQLLPHGVLPTISLVLIALLFIREVRREADIEENRELLRGIEAQVRGLQEGLHPDITLIGPHRLREESERFALNSRGEMIWFHVCLSMFRPQSLFDALLKPAIENPHVTSIQFTLDERQKALWATEVMPKVNACNGREKIREPHWAHISENVSFVLSDAASEGDADCLLSFWGEPFMASSIGPGIPRYIFYVHKHSELVSRFRDLERSYRISV